MIQLGGSLSHLCESLSQLVKSWSYMGEPWTIWKGLGVNCEGLGARWEPRKGTVETDRERKRQNGAFLVCGGTIGHCPLWGRCLKAINKSKTVFQGLLDETLCNLLGCIQAE